MYKWFNIFDFSDKYEKPQAPSHNTSQGLTFVGR